MSETGTKVKPAKQRVKSKRKMRKERGTDRKSDSERMRKGEIVVGGGGE